MSPSMEKEGIDYEVFKHIFSRAESDRDTLAKDQIHLAAFLCIPVSERLERCLGKHPEKLWVKIPNYFCLSTYIFSTPVCLADHSGAPGPAGASLSHPSGPEQM